MSEEIKSLSGEKAVDKIREMAEKKICMFSTFENGQMISRPMATSAVDDEGNLWFFSKLSSNKNQQLSENRKVDLVYIDTSKSHFLVLKGNGSVVTDKNKAKEYWSPIDKAWFEEGVDDPDLSLLKVAPSEGHYWDTKNGKLLTMLNIAVAAITGKEMNDGIEGDVKP